MVWLWVAQHIALFVMCDWDVRYDGKLIATHSHTMWLFDVTSQRIRWGLVIYKEFLLMAMMIAVYALLLTSSRSLRTRFRGWIGGWSR